MGGPANRRVQAMTSPHPGAEPLDLALKALERMRTCIRQEYGDGHEGSFAASCRDDYETVRAALTAAHREPWQRIEGIIAERDVWGVGQRGGFATFHAEPVEPDPPSAFRRATLIIHAPTPSSQSDPSVTGEQE